MIQQKPAHRRAFACIGIVTALASVAVVPMSAQAQTHHKNIFQRHRKLSSAAAGIAAYKAAKHTGKNRTANGGKKNFAQRHPYLTGAAAALGTHHLLKKH